MTKWALGLCMFRRLVWRIADMHCEQSTVRNLPMLVTSQQQRSDQQGPPQPTEQGKPRTLAGDAGEGRGRHGLCGFWQGGLRPSCPYSMLLLPLMTQVFHTERWKLGKRMNILKKLPVTSLPRNSHISIWVHFLQPFYCGPLRTEANSIHSRRLGIQIKGLQES
jgi:hypothetical protein